MTGNSGQPVKNQFLIYAPNGVYFQSYDSVIAFRDHNGNIFLDENKWDYSMTTGKYRNIFLHEDKRATEKKIKEGRYTLTNLNHV